MAHLAPSRLVFPKGNQALPERIWRGKLAADDAVMALVAKRRLHAANDNLRKARVTA